MLPPSVQGRPPARPGCKKQADFLFAPKSPSSRRIGRLVPQKGWDLLAEVAHRLLELDVQLIVLGTGQPKYHRLLERLAKRYEGKLRVYLGFNDSLAHQIEAGADLFLMPSLYEPCGLNQLYSLAHGTVPLVRSTGGLADTVVNTDLQALADRTANGFAFAEPTAGAPSGIRSRHAGNLARPRNLGMPGAKWNGRRLVMEPQCGGV